MKMFSGWMPSSSALRRGGAGPPPRPGAGGGLQLLALPEVGGEGHHLRPVLGLQPLQDDRGVQPAGIGEHDLLGCVQGVRRPSAPSVWMARRMWLRWARVRRAARSARTPNQMMAYSRWMEVCARYSSSMP